MLRHVREISLARSAVRVFPAAIGPLLALPRAAAATALVRSCLSCFSSMPGADNVYMAKLAEQAERYEEMVRAPRRRCRTAPPSPRLPRGPPASPRTLPLRCAERASRAPSASHSAVAPSPLFDVCVHCGRPPPPACRRHRAPRTLWPACDPRRRSRTCGRWLTSPYLPTSPYKHPGRVHEGGGEERARGPVARGAQPALGRVQERRGRAAWSA